MSNGCACALRTLHLLLDAIEQAHSHLLILSAHVSKQMLNTLKAPITAAIQRGVCVDVLSGLPSADEEGERHTTTTKKWCQDLRKTAPNGIGDRLVASDEPLNSDAKVLVWDADDGEYSAIVTSFNWLYGNSGSADDPGSDIGMRIRDQRLIGSICSTLSGWIDTGGQKSSGISLRWSQIGRHLAQLEPSNEMCISTRIYARAIYDEGHAEVLREGLSSSSKRCLVISHKINRSAIGSPGAGGGKLDWLIRRSPNPDFKFHLVSGKAPKADHWNCEDQDRLKNLVEQVNGSMSLDGGSHSRVLVYDDTIVITSYNFLSTTNDMRQIGVMLRSQKLADRLWKELAPAAGLNELSG